MAKKQLTYFRIPNMKTKINLTILTISLISIALAGCATIIGGFSSTARSSGDGMGPSTIIESDATLSNDKFNALTVSNGSLNISSFVIANNLNVANSLTATKLKVRKETTIGGGFGVNNSSFYGVCSINGSVISNGSYFAKDIEFGGARMELTNKTKVIGDVISTNLNPTTIIIDHSIVKGNIGFANSNSVVILQNKGHLTGKLINGKIQDLTGGDNYEGDDDLPESAINQ